MANTTPYFKMADLYGHFHGASTTEQSIPEPKEQSQLETSKETGSTVPVSPEQNKNVRMGLILLLVILVVFHV